MRRRRTLYSRATRRVRWDIRGSLQGLGGLLFATGAGVLLIRKSLSSGWGEFPRFLVVMVPTTVLYCLSLFGPAQLRGERRRAARALMIVTAILLTPLTLYELLAWLGASPRHALYNAGVFALTAALAGYAARRTRVPYTAFLSALALLIAWLLVWDKLLDHPSPDTFRWLLVAGAVVLLAIAGALARAGASDAQNGAPAPWAARELATVGGLAAVAAGAFGVLVGSIVGSIATFSGFGSGSVVSSGSGRSSNAERIASPEVHHSPIHTSGLQHPGWNVYLLIVSVALVWLAARTRVRGLGYVGAIGLFAFVLSAGLQITRLESGHTPTTSAGGWPLILLIIGAAGVLGSLLMGSGSAGEPVADNSS